MIEDDIDRSQFRQSPKCLYESAMRFSTGAERILDDSHCSEIFNQVFREAGRFGSLLGVFLEHADYFELQEVPVDVLVEP